MGGRGAFVDIDFDNFSFKEKNQFYYTIGMDEEIKYLIQEEGKGGKKIPDFSHSPNAVYVLIDRGAVKSIGVYANHRKIKSYDFTHTHYEPTLNKTLGWHYHTDLYHQAPAHELDDNDMLFVEKIMKGAKKFL